MHRTQTNHVLSRRDSAVALRAGEDARAAVLRLSRAHERFVSSRAMASWLRPVVADSWQRCAAAGASPDGRRLPDLRMDADELTDYRSGHPFAVLLPMFSELLGERADDGQYIFSVADADGTLMWVQGHQGTLRRAARMNFAEGATWSEAEAGTNAPGTALAVGRPVQIFAAEHYNSVAHPWSCSAAPIRDPVSGRVLGVVDITGGENVASPYALALVKATARSAEAELALRAAVTSARSGEDRAAEDRAAEDRAGENRTGENDAVAIAATGSTVADGTMRLTALGRDCALLELDGRVLRLRPRHSEIVVLLALAGEGLPGPRLAVELSEEEISPVTLRAEMSRLRTLLGGSLLGSRPYGLRRPVRADFTGVSDLLAEGRVATALAAYRGPLLPNSEAPAIVWYRAVLEQQLRAEVLASADAAVLRRWVSARWGTDDAEAWLALARLLPAASPQRAAAAARACVTGRELALSRPAAPGA